MRDDVRRLLITRLAANAPWKNRYCCCREDDRGDTFEQPAGGFDRYAVDYPSRIVRQRSRSDSVCASLAKQSPRPLIVNYHGHGSTPFWVQPTFWSRDVNPGQHRYAGDPGDELPNGLFLDPAYESLAENLLRAHGALWPRGVSAYNARGAASQQALTDCCSTAGPTSQAMAAAKSAGPAAMSALVDLLHGSGDALERVPLPQRDRSIPAVDAEAIACRGGSDNTEYLPPGRWNSFPVRGSRQTSGLQRRRPRRLFICAASGAGRRITIGRVSFVRDRGAGV